MGFVNRKITLAKRYELNLDLDSWAVLARGRGLVFRGSCFENKRRSGKKWVDCFVRLLNCNNPMTALILYIVAMRELIASKLKTARENSRSSCTN